jgi:hypothetical protein
MGNDISLQTAIQLGSNPVIKAQPTLSDVHVNALLTNMCVAYFQDQSKFIATKVFPSIPVDKQANNYPIWNADDFQRNVMRKRAPSTETAGGNIAPTYGTYFTQVYGFHIDLDDQLRANYDVAYRFEQALAQFLTTVDLVCREINWVNTYFTSGVWATDKTGGSDFVKWNDQSSTPSRDIKNAKRYMLEQTGYEPNTLVLSQEVYDALTENAGIVDIVKYGQTPGSPAMVTLETLKRVFELDDIYVMKSIYNTKQEGQTAVNAFTSGGKHALLCHVNKAGLIFNPSAGYTFNWNGYIGSGVNGSRTKTFRMENITSDRNEIEAAWDMKLVASSLGYMFLDAADMSSSSAT